jgi:hypothetical protein
MAKQIDKCYPAWQDPIFVFEFCSQPDIAYSAVVHLDKWMTNCATYLRIIGSNIEKFVKTWTSDNDNCRYGRTKKIQRDSIEKLIIDNHQRIKKLQREWMHSPEFANINFILSCIWPSQYLSKYDLSLSLQWTQINVPNIPVSSYEVITWMDAIISFVDRLAYMKHGTQIWFKFWFVDLMMCDAFAQIVEYMLVHITMTENMLQKHMEK